MAHIHLGYGEHDFTVSGFIVRTDFAEPRIMLHKHKKLGKYAQFGGHVELTENPWQALTHELWEESGYNLDQLRLLQPKERISRLPGGVTHPYPVCINTHAFNAKRDHFHTDTVYAFVTDQEPQGTVEGEESTDFAFFSRSELANTSSETVLPDILTVGEFIFEVCLAKWEQIPASEWQ